MLSSIRVVDLVYISNVNPNGYETIQLLKPNSVVFCDETSKEKVSRWAANIASCSPQTKIRLLARYSEEEVSTSYIINKIRDTTR